MSEFKGLLDEQIEQFNSLPNFVKGRILAQAEQTKKLQERNVEILSIFSQQGKGQYIEAIVGDYAIVVDYKPINFDGIDYPYSYAFFDEEKWRKGHSVYTTIEKALLGAIGHKAEGANSRFEQYASRMLSLDDKE